ncbi:MAG: branched-chain amino acid ABC transporter permease, partial [Actinobacteria bacterium]|nr:branched-chain amino acid ABC transporter permease [Actinomycetota bacterium]
MQSFIQFLIIGLGVGATYALFAQGAVLIYRGSGLVNFGQGAIGTFAAYLAFVDLAGDREWSVWPAIAVAVLAAALVSLAFQAIVLRALRNAAPIVRVIATIALLGLLQAIGLKRYGASNQPVDSYLPDDLFQWGEYTVQEQRLYLVGITLAITAALWAWTKYTRVGLAINASAENERGVKSLGWSPDRLAALTWTIGGALGGVTGLLRSTLDGVAGLLGAPFGLVAGLFCGALDFLTGGPRLVLRAGGKAKHGTDDN